MKTSTAGAHSHQNKHFVFENHNENNFRIKTCARK